MGRSGEQERRAGHESAGEEVAEESVGRGHAGSARPRAWSGRGRKLGRSSISHDEAHLIATSQPCPMVVCLSATLRGSSVPLLKKNNKGIFHFCRVSRMYGIDRYFRALEIVRREGPRSCSI